MQSRLTYGGRQGDICRTPKGNRSNRPGRVNPQPFQSTHRAPPCSASYVPWRQRCSPAICQAVSEQQAPMQSIASLCAELYNSSAAPGQCWPGSANTQLSRHLHLQQQQPYSKRSLVLATATAASGPIKGDSSSACMPSSAPVGPQRAATQRTSSSATAFPAAAAAATAAAPCVTLQQEQYPQQQHQHSVAHHDSSMSQAHVWLPDKQLWLPHPAPAVASPSNPLSRPSSSGSGLTRVFMASAATAGRKRQMEDRHVLAALHPQQGVSDAAGAITPQHAVSLAAVFDGHAGEATAAFAAKHIPRLLHNALSGQHGGAGSEGGPAVLTRELLTPRSALAASFHWFDRWWQDARCDPNITQYGWDESGSTAVVGMVSGQQLVIANAGDSIALMASNGTSRRLTEEHRLDNEAEVARVREAGGQVVRSHAGGAPRVVGSTSQTRYKGIMVTRSLGDFAFKSPQALISAEPYVNTHQLEPSDHLVLLTSDGVTDVVPDDDMLDIGLRAIEQARSRTNVGSALAKAAAEAVMHAAMQKGSNDNITVVAMLLDWGSQFEDDPQ